MKKVIFNLLYSSGNLIKYPDDISLFANTDLKTVPGRIIADYSGTLNLEAYTPAPVNYGQTITVFAFRGRFKNNERAVLDLYSIDDPQLSAVERLKKAEVRQFFEDLRTAPRGEVELNYKPTQDGVRAACEVLLASGVILDKDQRYNEIINEPVAFSELPDSLKAKFV